MPCNYNNHVSQHTRCNRPLSLSISSILKKIKHYIAIFVLDKKKFINQTSKLQSLG